MAREASGEEGVWASFRVSKEVGRWMRCPSPPLAGSPPWYDVVVSVINHGPGRVEGPRTCCVGPNRPRITSVSSPRLGPIADDTAPAAGRAHSTMGHTSWTLSMTAC